MKHSFDFYDFFKLNMNKIFRSAAVDTNSE